MRRLGSVQQKIPCVFLTEVREEPSKKRECQLFQVVATETLNPTALESNVDCALATEKLDGTCCYVSTFNGKPYLWARLDRRPTKQADKKFKKFQHSMKSDDEFTWNVDEDFRTVPDAWIPAHRVELRDRQPVPDEHGHIPGWVPVEKANKQYCWHSSAVDYNAGSALVLRPQSDDVLEITAVLLSDLLEQTLELIGTNVNGNPYGLGSKKQPIHVLVPHGSVPIRDAPAVGYQQLLAWFQSSEEGRVEGIVWHCSNGSLFKLHRHHIRLKWPDGGAFLSARAVTVHVSLTGGGPDAADLFQAFSTVSGRRFSGLQDVRFEL